MGFVHFVYAFDVFSSAYISRIALISALLISASYRVDAKKICTEYEATPWKNNLKVKSISVLIPSCGE